MIRWLSCLGLCLTLTLSLLPDLRAQARLEGGMLTIPLNGPEEQVDPAVAVEDMATVRTLRPGEPVIMIPEQTLGRFSDYIAGLCSDYGLPGMAFAIVQGDEVVQQRTLGYANLKTGTPITDATRFNIGPATQAMTSLLAATYDGERFTYDKPAQKLWARFRMSDEEVSRRVTIRDLLTMTAGVPDYTDNILDPAWARPEDVLAVIAQAPVTASPGSRFDISQVSVAAAGYLIPRADGGDEALYDGYIDAVQTRVFDPLGMTDSTFSLSLARQSGDWARPHEYEDRGRYDPATSWQPEPNAIAPAIGMKSSLRDLVKWLITELNEGVTPDGVRIANSLAVRERWQPAQTADSRNYGMGWTRRYYRGVEIIGMMGSYDRHSMAIAIYPGYHTGFVALMNTDGPDVQKLLTELPLGIAEMLQSQERK